MGTRITSDPKALLHTSYLNGAKGHLGEALGMILQGNSSSQDCALMIALARTMDPKNCLTQLTTDEWVAVILEILPEFSDEHAIWEELTQTENYNYTGTSCMPGEPELATFVQELTKRENARKE